MEAEVHAHQIAVNLVGLKRVFVLVDISGRCPRVGVDLFSRLAKARASARPNNAPLSNHVQGINPEFGIKSNMFIATSKASVPIAR